jgi:hypothetical protein
MYLPKIVGYDCFIILQYYYLDIKILKFYKNFEIYKITAHIHEV